MGVVSPVVYPVTYLY